MGQVTLTVNGRRYTVACDDGQETRLSELASGLDDRVRKLVAAVGQIGEDRLLLMAGLLVADELSDARAQLSAARASGDGGPALGDGVGEELSELIEALARRIEGVAVRLKAT